MSRLREHLASRLSALEDEGLLRGLQRPAGVDFCSNDYLGLSLSDELRALTCADGFSGPISSPASRLLRGNLEAHEQLEDRLARFKGTERALLFSTGYHANLGVLTALTGPEDRVLSDELNHASIIDGVRLSGASKVVFPHLDASVVARELAKPWPAPGRTFLVTESYFSMDGDIAPLRDYAELVEHHDASLIVDDAHATGVYGDERGSGLVETQGVAGTCDAIVSTFGKALGGFGAFVAGPAQVIDWLINSARSFIFTTALPPIVLRLIEAGVDICERAGDLRSTLHARSARLRAALRANGLDCLASEGPILPVVLGDHRVAIEVGKLLASQGFDVRAIRPPSVPPGTARLRISVHVDHDEETIDRLASAVVETVESVSATR